jgi:hypothetical protein
MQPDVNLAETRSFAAHLDRQICRLIDKYIKISFKPQKGEYLRLKICGGQGARLEGDFDSINFLIHSEREVSGSPQKGSLVLGKPRWGSFKDLFEF